MASVVEEAKSLVESIGAYARTVIVGVWFPGFLLCCEIAYLVYSKRLPSSQSLLGYANALLKEQTPVTLTAVVILFLASSIAAGYLARDIAFWLSDLWLRRAWRPTRKLSDIIAQIKAVHGAKRVDEITAKYQVFQLATDEATASTLPRSAESYVRDFCKLWLRWRAPALSTEGIETEINMDVGLVLPIAFASVVLFSAGIGFLGIALGVLCILAAIFRLYRITWARNVETEHAIVNFLFAHWEPKSSAVVNDT